MKLIKEEYGPYRGNMYLEEIANEVEIGNKIASILAKAIGRVGAFAEEELVPEDNVLTLISQGGEEKYRFNNNGSVDFINAEEAIDDWIAQGEIDEEDKEWALEEYSHYDSVLDLLSSDLSWFNDIDSRYINQIKRLLGE